MAEIKFPGKVLFRMYFWDFIPEWVLHVLKEYGGLYFPFKQGIFCTLFFLFQEPFFARAVSFFSFGLVPFPGG